MGFESSYCYFAFRAGTSFQKWLTGRTPWVKRGHAAGFRPPSWFRITRDPPDVFWRKGHFCCCVEIDRWTLSVKLYKVQIIWKLCSSKTRHNRVKNQVHMNLSFGPGLKSFVVVVHSPFCWVFGISNTFKLRMDIGALHLSPLRSWRMSACVWAWEA